MAFYFRNFPFVFYDVKKDDNIALVQNPLVRFKLKDILKQRNYIYLDYIVEEGENASVVAEKFYDDETLDWVIYIVNDIIDPKYDWPLHYNEFNNFIIQKYGSVEAASRLTSADNIHHYEYIVRERTRLFDDTVLPEKSIRIDKTRYDELVGEGLFSSLRIVRNYDYEEELNNQKREIKVLKDDYLPRFVSEVKSVLQE